ncbi:hypothetical protein PQU63_18775 [Xanthomonas protegens]|uniref:Uncharacterized protein n=1 Tax=Xanthomonas protegens TaxID=3380705 RepID=A0ABU9LGI9_9XANT
MKFRVSSISLALGLLLCVIASPAMAVTECMVTPKAFYVGDSMLWVDWVEGGAGIIRQSDPDFNPTLAVVSMAVTNQKSLVVRYSADNVDCAGRNDIAGIWMSR